MYLERHDFKLEIELLSDLHIGDGATKTLSALNLVSSKADPTVKTIVRDANELPWLPPTSLKGAICDLIDDPQGALFGIMPMGNGHEGSGGRLLLWGGLFKPVTAPGAITMPFWDQARHSFIMPHVRIDRASGAAAENRLFHREYVPKGCCFAVEGCWLGSTDEFDALVVPLFEAMAAGFPLGAASGAGFGRVRLVDRTIVVTQHVLVNDNGYPRIDPPRDRDVTITPAPAPATKTLALVCPGPLLIVDPQRHADPETTADDHIDMFGLMRDATLPELLGTGVIGVLRSRASWLQQTRMGLAADDPDGKYDAAKQPNPRTALTPCQRLFGVAGWAKKLRIADIALKLNGPANNRYPGIALDDFTQASIEGALFGINAPANLQLNVAFECGTRHYPLDACECALIELIWTDIARYGLHLGHSGGVGFGWFEVASAAPSVDAGVSNAKAA